MAPRRRRGLNPPADHPVLVNLRNKLAIRWYLDSQAPSSFVHSARPATTASKSSPSVMETQKLRRPGPKDTSAFYRSLEARLDRQRVERRTHPHSKPREKVDFSSTDFLSLSSSGLVRMAFFDELARHPGFHLRNGGAPMLHGNSSYVETLEQELADFHRAEKGLMFSSGYDAAGAVYKVIPQEGDAIVFDENVHASIHDAMRSSPASIRQSFSHNNLGSFSEVLTSVKESDEDFEDGLRTVLISIESVYSMDGDVAPIKEMVCIAKEIFPLGNYQFVIDEAHSTGLIGHKGDGLVCALGLEKEIAIRLHSFGTALGAQGAVALCNDTTRLLLANYTRSLIYSTTPSLSTLATIRGGYNLMKSGLTQERQNRLQHLVRHFYKSLHSNPVWAAARTANIISIPMADKYETEQFLTHVVPICTREKENHLLAAHLQSANYCAWPIDHPAVPKGQGRVRLVFHAANTEAEVDLLVSLVGEFAQAVLDERAARAKIQGHHMALHLEAAKQMASFGRADWDALLQLQGSMMTEETEINPEDCSPDHITTPERILPEKVSTLAGYPSLRSTSPAETTPALSTGLTERSTSTMGESLSAEDALPETEGKLRKASFALEAWKLQQSRQDVAKKVSADPQVAEILAEMAATVSIGC
ncbi:MAG: Pyridoxal phosphate-dependent major domain-containing protein [Lasallia pustulata]|uniref:Pyridoxal phosphate-dependent major domain-containing protein n=1 Tax=Lasallia pustulata TaxID=136370 RepID=A0A5M8PWD4_9LECA|nr:MAG: Pyridoxal phosphate-dependent major domain-containing protein [Lasallia pustulata]